MCEDSVFLKGNCMWQGESSLINFLKAEDSTVDSGSMSSNMYSVTSFRTSPGDTLLFCSVIYLLGSLSPLSATDILCFAPAFSSGKIATTFVVL